MTEKGKPTLWKFEPQADYTENARLLGKVLEGHEGYFRENDGSWIITDENGERIAAVQFKGKAKRGQTWCAPDPEGQSNAKLIVQSVNHAGQLAEALRNYHDSDGGCPCSDASCKCRWHEAESALKAYEEAGKCIPGE